ncbi:MAG: sigma factor, partial [Pseudomonadota bacterium]
MTCRAAQVDETRNFRSCWRPFEEMQTAMNQPPSRDLRVLFETRRHVFISVLMRRLGSREDAEDVLQDALVKFHQMPASDEIENPEAYLMKVALNLATDRLRQTTSSARREKTWSAEVLNLDQAKEPSSPVDSIERDLIARQAIEKL